MADRYAPAKIGEPITDADTPALVVDVAKLMHNIRLMREMVAELHKQHHVPHHIAIRPHYKTHKCLDIALRQLFDRGAGYPHNSAELAASPSSAPAATFTSGVCCAKLAECESIVYGRCSDGTRSWLRSVTSGSVQDEADVHWDILLTNEIMGKKKMARLARLLAVMQERARRVGKAAHGFKIAVDCRAHVDQLADVARTAGVVLPLYIELQNGGGRCGVDSAGELVELAKYIKAHPAGTVTFSGIHAYQGRNQHIRNHADRVRAVLEGDATKMVREALGLLKSQGVVAHTDVVPVSGAGTGTFPLEIASGVFTEIQPGSYAVMDADYLANANPSDIISSSRFATSLTVLSTITSTHASPARLICDAGLKAVSVETYLPTLVSILPATAKGAQFWRNGDGVTWKYVSGGDEHGVLVPKNRADEEQVGPWLRAVSLENLVGGKAVLVAGHCDPTINMHEHIVATEDGVVVSDVWNIGGRGVGF
ncbi:hypothetical protein M427DRAFT_140802 [Gonapodya prolifera JEL478]|uniref:D-serine dehydratase-like domain-containing protein n=1 Tax=Gonapodya prolifera (strain JEL478) TaxID=1344416 RepID=A0A138ZY92_GONPJ|nr:hypothetical protein M427DRAFT_140802 [Gonapodya prolifera JEL478]|eukprot:KXS09466.1 hypothetical protein M427DRAFT_140802 [Gonapodya prolifera JEL478]